MENRHSAAQGDEILHRPFLGESLDDACRNTDRRGCLRLANGQVAGVAPRIVHSLEMKQLSGFIDDGDADAHVVSSRGFKAASRNGLCIVGGEGGFCLHRQTPNPALLRHVPTGTWFLIVAYSPDRIDPSCYKGRRHWQVSLGGSRHDSGNRQHSGA
jgi:hypothetical protein